MVSCDQKSKSSISDLKHYQTYISSLDDLALNDEIVSLGEDLFFDPILSTDNTVSCASCHHPSKAFTDGKTLPVGIMGRTSQRNAPTLMNLSVHPHFMFDGGNATLEIQALTPIRDTNEMGSDIKSLIEKLQKSEYNKRSLELFDRSIDPFVLTRSLAAFQKNLISLNSPFDQWYYLGNENAVSNSVKNGFKLFDDKLHCTSCHKPPYFTNFEFENNGLLPTYNDRGRFMVSGDSSDMYKFKVPTLRNIELTAPYLHNGSIPTLDSLILLYRRGGFDHPTKNAQIQPLDLSENDLNDLKQFLQSLTDTSFIEKLKPEHKF